MSTAAYARAAVNVEAALARDPDAAAARAREWEAENPGKCWLCWPVPGCKGVTAKGMHAPQVAEYGHERFARMTGHEPPWIDCPRCLGGGEACRCGEHECRGCGTGFDTGLGTCDDCEGSGWLWSCAEAQECAPPWHAGDSKNKDCCALDIEPSKWHGRTA